MTGRDGKGQPDIFFRPKDMDTSGGIPLSSRQEVMVVLVSGRKYFLDREGDVNIWQDEVFSRREGAVISGMKNSLDGRDGK